MPVILLRRGQAKVLLQALGNRLRALVPAVDADRAGDDIVDALDDGDRRQGFDTVVILLADAAWPFLV
jgi:hypothetical protein